MRTGTDFVVAGPAGKEIARKLAAELRLPVLEAEVTQFPDGESCLRLPQAAPIARAVIVQSGGPPQDTGMVHFLQLIDIVKHAGARTLIGVSPYLPYARQDRRSRRGEPETCALWLNALASAGLDRLLTLEAHNPSVLARSALPCCSLSSVEALAELLNRLDLSRPFILSPDEGGRERAEALARQLGWPSGVLSKKKTADGTFYEEVRAPVRGRDVVVVDDLCSSGSTLIPLTRALHDAGAASVSVGVVHFLGRRDALLDKLPSVRSFLFSDSLDQGVADFACAPIFARALDPLLRGDRNGPEA